MVTTRGSQWRFSHEPRVLTSESLNVGFGSYVPLMSSLPYLLQYVIGSGR